MCDIVRRLTNNIHSQTSVKFPNCALLGHFWLLSPEFATQPLQQGTSSKYCLKAFAFNSETTPTSNKRIVKVVNELSDELGTTKCNMSLSMCLLDT